MLTGRKLLLADDSLTIQKVVSLTFNDEAMEVTTVGGGAEALEHLGESLPDIVLADVFMPEPNGYALCERIKRDERTRHIPVVLLVGTFEPFNEAEARRVGADEVLTKPFQSIRDLVNKVGGLLGGQPDEKRPDAGHAPHERPEEETTRDLSPFADDARAADPASATPAAATHAPADAFADFDMDDATIQTTPVAAFDAQQQQHAAPAFSEIKEEEQFSDRGEMPEAFVLTDDDSSSVLSDDDAILSIEDAPAPETHAATAAAAAAATSHASAPASAPAAESALDAHSSRAAESDDALLDFGDVAPTRASSAAAASDDFILDIDDEAAFDSAAAFGSTDDDILASGTSHDAAAAEADMFFAEHAPTTEAPQAFSMPGAFTEPEASAGSQMFVEPSVSEEAEMLTLPEAEMTDVSAAAVEDEAAPVLHAQEELRAPEISAAPDLLFANEPAADEREPDAPSGETGTSREHDAPTWDGDPVAASAVAHAGSVAAIIEASGASHAAEPVAADTDLAAVAASAPVASSESDQAASSGSSRGASAAASLSPEMLDEVVRRVVAQMSEQVVREIAWEVVPDLAERLIKQRLEEERARTQ